MKELAEILNIVQSNPLVQKALDNFSARQTQIKNEQDYYLNLNLIESGEKMELSGDSLAREIRRKLDSDEISVKQFNQKIISYANPNEISFQVKSNKMEQVIAGTRKLFGDDETNISKLAAGISLSEFSNEIDGVPLLGGKSFWGTSKPTFLSSAILTTYFTLTGKTVQDLPLDLAILHVSQIPDDLEIDVANRFSYKKGLTSGFAFFHSGYSFGGHRNEEIFYPSGKIFGPEDCSSWVSKITGCPFAYSTADQLCVNRMSDKSGFIPQTWENESMAKNMIDLYQPIHQNDILPGDVHIVRTFDATKNIQDNLGCGGHTTLVLGGKDENTLYTLGHNRDMPIKEGFGVEEFALNPVPTANRTQLVMFQRLREDVAEPEYIHFHNFVRPTC